VDLLFLDPLLRSHRRPLSPRHRRPWWPTTGGRGVLFLVVVGCLVLSPSSTNNLATIHGSTHALPSAVHGWIEGLVGSNAGTYWPNPWQVVASALLAPFPPLFPSLNKVGPKFLYLFVLVIKVEGGMSCKIWLGSLMVVLVQISAKISSSVFLVTVTLRDASLFSLAVG
jgi:hypothetical protein